MPSGIIAVIRAGSARDAVEIGVALSEAGVAHLEVTFTVPDAPDAIRELDAAVSATVGAGTVVTEQQATLAAEVGARFLVSPTLDQAVARRAADLGLPYIPGALTPTEVAAALAAGAAAVKLFPIGSVGGAAHVRALREVFPDAIWVVSGGVRPIDVGGYRDAGVTGICLGGALIDRDALARRDRPALVAHAVEALRTVGGA